MKILLIEDNELNLDMLTRRLVRKGFTVISALDGLSGIEKANQEKPELIIMDLSLPVLDGWGRSSIHGVYFAGDISRLGPPAVVTAVASGASSAKAIAEDFRGSHLWSL